MRTNNALQRPFGAPSSNESGDYPNTIHAPLHERETRRPSSLLSDAWNVDVMTEALAGTLDHEVDGLRITLK